MVVVETRTLFRGAEIRTLKVHAENIRVKDQTFCVPDLLHTSRQVVISKQHNTQLSRLKITNPITAVVTSPLSRLSRATSAHQPSLHIGIPFKYIGVRARSASGTLRLQYSNNESSDSCMASSVSSDDKPGRTRFSLPSNGIASIAGSMPSSVVGSHL